MASIKLFGYLFFEIAGKETILVTDRENDSWDFPINTEINSLEETESRLDGIVDSLIQENFISFDSLLEENLAPYTLVDIPNSRARFVKLKVGRQSSVSDKYHWFDKEIFLQGNCKSQELLDLILKDYIFISRGLRVLECVDAIVFRKRSGASEFLLLRRKIANSNEFKYEYPKGGLKYHETVVEGALRELAEETGVSSYTVKDYLGLKAVDVRDRKREYDILRVHGLALEYHGSGKDILPSPEEGFDEIYDWVSFDEALEKIWMRTYGVEFLKTFKSLSS